MENIKTEFTDTELQEYIDLLNECVNDEKKAKKVLGINNLPKLVAYLKLVGMPEELLKKAAVIEATRSRILEIFTDSRVKSCKVTNTGIEYDFNYNKEYYRKERLGLDSKNIFRLSKEKYFGKDEVGNLYLMSDYATLYNPNILINDDGSMELPKNFAGYMGIEYKRKLITGVPHVVIIKKNVDGLVEYNNIADLGYPFFTGNQDSSFEENYNMYTTLFPNIKKWYDETYFNDTRNVKELSADIDKIVSTRKIYKYNLEIFDMKSKIMDGIKNYIEYKKELSKLIAKLQEYSFENEDEKNTVLDLISKAKELSLSNTEFDDENRMDEIKEELKSKEILKSYNKCGLDELHQIIEEKEKKKEKLKQINDPLTYINEKYKALFDAAQEIFDKKDIEKNTENKQDSEREER